MQKCEFNGNRGQISRVPNGFKPANADPLGDLEINIAGTVRLLEALCHLPEIPVTFASSGGTVYGELDILPIPEHHPLRPKTAYGVAVRDFAC